MFWRKKNRSSDQELDRMGGLLIRAAAMSDEEADSTASSPFLYQRIRAHILETERQNEMDGWRQILFAARSAIPIMVFAAIAAVALFLFSLSQENSSSSVNTFNDPQKQTMVPSTPAPACYMSIREQCSISSDEALTMIFNRTGQESQK